MNLNMITSKFKQRGYLFNSGNLIANLIALIKEKTNNTPNSFLTL